MKIIIMDTGTMGGLLGARLALAGQDVSFVEASETTIEVISRQGLCLGTSGVQEGVWVPISCIHQVTGHFDLLIVSTKGFHTATTIESVRHLVGPQTWALSMWSGLGDAELIARVVPTERIIVDMTSLSVDLVVSGAVHSHGEGYIDIQAGNGKDSLTVHEIAANFSQAGLLCGANPQVQALIWEKVAFNTTLNSVCAVTHRTVGVIGHAEGERQVTSRVVGETVAVVQATSVDADQRWVIAAADYAFRHHQQHRPSMLQDVEAGRKTGIGFTGGTVIECGKRLGVATLVLGVLLSLVKSSEGQISWR